MKHRFLTLGLLLTMSLVNVAFTSCSKGEDDNDNQETISTTTDQGVVINGVKWATRNVAAPGTFASKPEDLGKFYQWNSKVAWSATDKNVTGWKAIVPESSVWEKANDPSPAGWRIPTLEEIEKLFDPDKVNSKWVTQKGVNGKVFTDKITGNSIFLPAAGCRLYNDGALSGDGTLGYYWSSSLDELDEVRAHSLYFYNEGVGSGSYSQINAFSVRTVAEHL